MGVPELTVKTGADPALMPEPWGGAAAGESILDTPGGTPLDGVDDRQKGAHP